MGLQCQHGRVYHHLGHLLSAAIELEKAVPEHCHCHLHLLPLLLRKHLAEDAPRLQDEVFGALEGRRRIPLRVALHTNARSPTRRAVELTIEDGPAGLVDFAEDLIIPPVRVPAGTESHHQLEHLARLELLPHEARTDPLLRVVRLKEQRRPLPATLSARPRLECRHVTGCQVPQALNHLRVALKQCHRLVPLLTQRGALFSFLALAHLVD
mmetsp:Transcript_78/g.262  ORF Transcript_78/g.262 Transcript_78/m.262 type:complete len:211 (-) Transcript_78:515-1147(-)